MSKPSSRPAFSSVVPTPAASAALRPSEAPEECLRYTGALQPDKGYYDGRLPHAVGVHHIQAFRANRTATGGTGCTYNHQPFLVWWRDRFYLQFLSAPVHEHEAPTITFLISSADGYAWSSPEPVFPQYRLPAFHLNGVDFPEGMCAVMHQRMGFYVAPNGRLLTLGFYGICPDHQHSPNAGRGVGRVVREIRADGALGDIHFIRYHRQSGFDERNTRFPSYRLSDDEGFRAACQALLDDKLATLQWWEEDRGTDGFFALDPGAVADAARFDGQMVTSAGAGKAFTWYTRTDGVLVGLWKNQYSALSHDGGRTWSPITRSRTLRTTGAKVWGQRTSDGRFAVVYNHSATGVNRFPISALVGEDGRDFNTLVCLGGEVPPRRFRGQHKSAGLHYFRGISEGSAQPPGGDLWVAYSTNKEDLWLLRARVPLAVAEPEPLAENFAAASSIADLPRWNFHLPQWAAARIVTEPGTARRVLELRDEDPGDYAWAERVFPAAARVRIRFRVQGRELPIGASFEIEVQSQRHDRPLRLRFITGWVLCDRGQNAQRQLPFALERWHTIQLDCDCGTQSFAVAVDDVTTHANVPFAESMRTLERIVFRTGPWRGLVPPHLVESGGDRPPGLDTEDLPGADARVAPTVFWIDDLTTEAE